MSAPSPVWHDPAALDARWREPKAAGRWPVPVAIGVALALLIGVVAVLGGFGQRNETAETRIRPPGTTFTTGPYEFTFTHATVSRESILDETKWRAVAHGTGRLVEGDKAMAPFSTNFALFDPVSGARAEYETQSVGPVAEDGYNALRAFTPGLAPEEYRLTFDMGTTYQVSGYVVFLMKDLRFRDTTFLQIDNIGSWGNERTATAFYLPVTIVAPRQ